MLNPVEGIINATIIASVLIPFTIFITINQKANSWLDKHSNVSALIGLVVLFGGCYIIVAVFWFGWNTLPPMMNEIAKSVGT